LACVVPGCTSGSSHSHPPTATAVGSSDSSPQSTATVAPSSVYVAVYNGSEISCAADETSTALIAQGFVVTDLGNGPSNASTVIEYPADLVAQANTLHAVVSGAQMRATNAVNAVTLIIGSDGQTVNGLNLATAAPTCDAVRPPDSGRTAG
jgi:LytR cell envelope-related transcriptional attenuator